MTLALWFIAGLVGGTAHFALLRWNTQLYVGGGIAHAIGVQVVRLVGVSMLLGLAASRGALPVMLAALGVILARAVALRALP